MAIKNQTAQASATTRCPVDHETVSRQKTRPESGRPAAPIHQDEDGVWHVYDYEMARSILRSGKTRQAGFGAEWMDEMPSQGAFRMTNIPILYLEGEAHNEQRKRSARFFTPSTVSGKYRQFMEDFSDQVLAPLKEHRQADLSQISMRLAVQVAGQVVGLTNSRLPGIDRRLDRFFKMDHPVNGPQWLSKLLYLYNQRDLLTFYFLDVQPAIRARRKLAAAGETSTDVIGFLIEQGYSNVEILTEVVTYAAAGMVTTREFISMAAWHLLENPDLLARYQTGSEKERYAILHEMLRLEPVVSELQRQVTEAIELESGERRLEIPAGALIKMEIYETNLDESATGPEPEMLCPVREVHGEGAQPMLLSFGDGPHRCPGAYIAIQETDIFLQKLFSLPDLYIKHMPKISIGELTQGYEIRDFVLGVSEK